MRLFVAIPLTPETRSSLEEAVQLLRQSRAPVRWVRPEALHLTLKFLGEVPPEKVEGISRALARAAAAVLPFPMDVAGAGTFPGKGRPRVVWADVREPSGALARLHGAVEQGLAAEGFDREKRRFSPHITLGRVRGSINLPRLAEAVARLGDQLWGRQTVERLSLLRSRLGPGGASYREVAGFTLGGAGDPAEGYHSCGVGRTG